MFFLQKEETKLLKKVNEKVIKYLKNIDILNAHSN